MEMHSELAIGADVVSHEATFAAGMERKAYQAQHSTAPMAGAFARRVRAQALVLTHFSNRYTGVAQHLHEVTCDIIRDCH